MSCPKVWLRESGGINETPLKYNAISGNTHPFSSGATPLLAPHTMQNPQEIADAVQNAEQGGLVGCTYGHRGGSIAIFLQLEIIFSMIQSPS
jgi:hypothetical protein